MTMWRPLAGRFAMLLVPELLAQLLDLMQEV